MRFSSKPVVELGVDFDVEAQYRALPLLCSKAGERFPVTHAGSLAMAIVGAWVSASLYATDCLVAYPVMLLAFRNETETWLEWDSRVIEIQVAGSALSTCVAEL